MNNAGLGESVNHLQDSGGGSVEVRGGRYGKNIISRFLLEISQSTILS